MRPRLQRIILWVFILLHGVLVTSDRALHAAIGSRHAESSSRDAALPVIETPDDESGCLLCLFAVMAKAVGEPSPGLAPLDVSWVPNLTGFHETAVSRPPATSSRGPPVLA